MTLGFERDRAINELVSKQRKALTVNFLCLFNAKPFSISQRLIKSFSREFQKVHQKDMTVRNLRCNVLIKGFSIGEDLGGKTSEKLVEIRKEFEKRTGLHISALDARYEQVNVSENEMPNWTFEFTFYDVDPTDPITGTGTWELYR